MKPPAVAVFTYNRPEKSIQVLEAVKSQAAKNVYIFCDGPKKDPTDQHKVMENIKIVRNFPIKNKQIFEESKNKGLANSLIDGITKVFEFETALIVLEDDCLPFDQMIRFMTENLAYWRPQRDIFSISAYHFIRPIKKYPIPYDVFLSQRFLPWGWATWRDRWQDIYLDLKLRVNPYKSYAHVPETAGRDMIYHTYAVENNMVDSWAIPLGLITLSKKYKHVMPIQPLVNNTGMDDSGTNTGSAHNQIQPIRTAPQYNFPLKMCPASFFDPVLENNFIDSLDVMLPPPWLLDKIRQEIALRNTCNRD